MDDVTLKEHLESRIDAAAQMLEVLSREREKQVAAALESASTAINKAETEMLRARADQNEWRESMNDLTARFATNEALDYVKQKQERTDTLVARMIGGLVAVSVLVPVASVLLARLIN